MKISCGIIPFRKNKNGELEFFLGHPGGNYKNCRNLWMFLKGAIEKDESWEDTALREFKEETGLTMDGCNREMLIPLGSVQQNPHKVTVAFGLHYPNIDPDTCVSNIADDGVTPEIDKYKWMSYDEVCKYTHHTHLWFYDQLIDMDKYCGFK